MCIKAQHVDSFDKLQLGPSEKTNTTTKPQMALLSALKSKDQNYPNMQNFEYIFNISNFINKERNNRSTGIMPNYS